MKMRSLRATRTSDLGNLLSLFNHVTNLGFDAALLQMHQEALLAIQVIDEQMVAGK